MGISHQAIGLSPWRDDSKIAVSPAECCQQAEGFVLEAGFKFIWQSQTSEARYFIFPGRHGVLRIAQHRKNYKNEFGHGRILASITYNELGVDGLCHTSRHKVEWTCATAIGLYMIRSKPRGGALNQNAGSLGLPAHCPLALVGETSGEEDDGQKPEGVLGTPDVQG